MDGAFFGAQRTPGNWDQGCRPGFPYLLRFAVPRQPDCSHLNLVSEKLNDEGLQRNDP